MKKILLIQTAFIGDVVLATPLLEKLHRFFPEAKIDFCLRKGNESLLKDHPFVNELLIFDKKKNKIRNLFRLLSRIKKTKYDLVVNMHRFASSGILTGFSNAKERIGFEQNPYSFLFTKKIKHEIGSGKHEVKRNLELIEHLTDSLPEKPKLYPSDADRKSISNYQSSGKYICIAPSSIWFTKQWPVEKWVELIQLVPETIRIYLLGGPDDSKICEDILKRREHKNITSLAGQLSFLQSAALMEGANMNYVNDSAPLHFTSAMNAPVTVVYCSTVPAFGFGPLSTISHVIENEEKLDCRPCGLHGHKVCPEMHFKCAMGIEPKKVVGDLK